jgi:hypothetical protein
MLAVREKLEHSPLHASDEVPVLSLESDSLKIALKYRHQPTTTNERKVKILLPAIWKITMINEDLTRRNRGSEKATTSTGTSLSLFLSLSFCLPSFAVAIANTRQIINIPLPSLAFSLSLSLSPPTLSSSSFSRWRVRKNCRWRRRSLP